jgi:hypothetical protein
MLSSLYLLLQKSHGYYNKYLLIENQSDFIFKKITPANHEARVFKLLFLASSI